tara:strand:+ start:1868 stop:2734 length:867 start_codon:yes stop_codon:yes gene_type:complete
MIFWRIIDNKILPVSEVESLGFEEAEGMRIPDEYLQEQEFVIMRGCHGIGDYGIISAMPRLLKEKYPNCGVFVPSNSLYQKLWGRDNKVVESIFKNNPYIDGFCDEVKGDIFHDHYRVWNKDESDIPLIKQMLKFWQFEDDEMEDYLPEIYWTSEEETLGNAIIKDIVGGEEFGCLMISDRFGQADKTFNSKTYEKHHDKLSKLLKENDYPYFYWSYKPIKELGFQFKKGLDFRNMDLRIQLYIKSKAKVNIGIQCGTTQCIVRYSDCISIQRQFPLGGNYNHKEIYV